MMMPRKENDCLSQRVKINVNSDLFIFFFEVDMRRFGRNRRCIITIGVIDPQAGELALLFLLLLQQFLCQVFVFLKGSESIVAINFSKFHSLMNHWKKAGFGAIKKFGMNFLGFDVFAAQDSIVN